MKDSNEYANETENYPYTGGLGVAVHPGIEEDDNDESTQAVHALIHWHGEFRFAQFKQQSDGSFEMVRVEFCSTADARSWFEQQVAYTALPAEYYI